MKTDAIAIISLVVAIIAIIFTALKDFILPWLKKPIIEINYIDEVPFVRVVAEKVFYRFRIRNIGKSSAINCRCQIISVIHNNTIYKDYTGFPLNWAGRPEYVLEPTRAERLNIGRGEIEYIDVVSFQESAVHFIKYHNVGIGIDEKIVEQGKYTIKLLFSGDNFKPLFISFDLKFLYSPIQQDNIIISNMKVTRSN